MKCIGSKVGLTRVMYICVRCNKILAKCMRQCGDNHLFSLHTQAKIPSVAMLFSDCWHLQKLESSAPHVPTRVACGRAHGTTQTAK